MNTKKLSLCKKLQYTILYNKKFDWLKRDNAWKLDKIDAYMGLTLLVVFLLTSFFGKVLVFPMIILFYIGMLIWEIRSIKSVPADIECQFTSKLRCIKYVFFVIFLILLVVNIVRVLICNL